MNEFVHLHVHSEYSLLDGACRIKDLIKKAKELGQSSLAITDHGVLYGAIDFYKEAKKEGIKPIIGCEVYVSPRSRMDKIHGIDSEYNHLVLLCKDEIGYKNLINMVSKSWTEGFYRKPRVDEELLKKYNKGLIALSGCIVGKIPKLLVKGNYDEAKKTALCYENIFGKNNFYLEVQDHGLLEQKRINPMLKKLSEETQIPLVATNDCHYINKEDSHVHQILLCIQTGHVISDKNKFEFPTDEFYIKSENEMKDLFFNYSKAIENTTKIADMCNLNFEFGKIKLPHFDVSKDKDHFEYFKEACYKGLYNIYGENPDEAIINRLNYELNIINKMGYIDYYLIVNDFVKYAKSKNIPVGPGRGSGAGSLAAYCMGITGVDPIKYNLLFERFLNPERISMPDFDIDFCYVRRHEVIEYVIKKYGEDHVAQIVTFGTMAAKAAIRDVGRVMGLPYSEVDSVAKLIPFELGVTIEKALKDSNELQEKYNNQKDIKKLIDIAKKIEGMPRHTSTHAAGVVITEHPVCKYVPLAKKDGVTVTQYTMTAIDELGLLKMDFLGLRNLTIINDTEKMIENKQKMSLEDKEVFDMFSQGNTEGVFQFESIGMRKVLKDLRPESIEDLIAVISLYRPGPMNSIPKYIFNRHNPKLITYKHPLLSKILDVTYGCIVYQEQVMQIFRTLAGYSLGRADIVRRAISKKKVDVMEKEREIFIYGLKDKNNQIEVEGCIKRGISEEIAKEVFEEMYNFASYAFNKSHATAYAMISYHTAWLKCKYPKEYMSAMLTAALDGGNDKKFSVYIEECRRLKIQILSPNVMHSNYEFRVENNNIRIGLLCIKGLGKNAVEHIISERNKEKFKSFYDFCNRIQSKDFNKRALQSLIRAGALDGLKANRRQMMVLSESILDEIAVNKRNNIEGQISFFHNEEKSEIDLPDVKDFSLEDKIVMEQDATGIAISNYCRQQNNNKIKSGLYIKVPNEESFEYNRSKILISIFEGMTPVYFYLEDRKKLFLAPRNMYVTPENILIKELKHQIGEKNIKLIKN